MDPAVSEQDFKCRLSIVALVFFIWSNNSIIFFCNAATLSRFRDFCNESLKIITRPDFYPVVVLLFAKLSVLAADEENGFQSQLQILKACI
jgi:hypothetical protein